MQCEPARCRDDLETVLYGQVAAVSCTRLKKLRLPNHILESCIPFQAAGHLSGLEVVGGAKTVSLKPKISKGL